MRRSFGLGLCSLVLLAAVSLIPSIALAAPPQRGPVDDPDGQPRECAIVWLPSCAVGLVEDLQNDVVELELNRSLTHSLGTKLDGAKRALQRENANSAAGHLRAFEGLLRAQSGIEEKKIFVYEAGELIAQAEVIIESIVGFAPGPPQTDNLNFMGGSVTEHPKIYITYWGFGWSYSPAKDPNGMVPILEGFLGNIGGTPYLEPLTQYYGYEYKGVPFIGQFTINQYYIHNDTDLLKGVWYDGFKPMPKNPTSGDIEKEVARAVQHFGYDPDGIYYIVTAPGRTWNVNACAYHASTQKSTAGSIIYVDLPYQPEVCNIGLSGDDATTIIAFHELIEAMTDPRYGDKPTWSSSFGWVATDGRENADKCGTLEGYPALDIVLNGATYAIQAQWSNKNNACVYF